MQGDKEEMLVITEVWLGVFSFQKTNECIPASVLSGRKGNVEVFLRTRFILLRPDIMLLPL